MTCTTVTKFTNFKSNSVSQKSLSKSAGMARALLEPVFHSHATWVLEFVSSRGIKDTFTYLVSHTCGEEHHYPGTRGKH